MKFKDILQILNTVFLAVMAISFMSIANSVSDYSVPERLTTIIEQTREIFSFEPQNSNEVERSQDSAGFEEQLTKDYACYEKIVNDQGVNEYGYLISGDFVNLLHRLEGWAYVEFSDEANVRHSNECWIWI